MWFFIMTKSIVEISSSYTLKLSYKWYYTTQARYKKKNCKNSSTDCILLVHVIHVDFAQKFLYHM